MSFIRIFGQYMLFLAKVFKRPERLSVYWKLIISEIYILGIKSLPFVIFVSVFVGAVVTLQTEANLEEGWLPRYLIGLATRDSIILEFSPTIISLLLAGKVGSYIASGIGTMKVTEQIDALEIMGVNPVGYLVLPKIIALVFINPFLIIISMFIGITGGWLAGEITGACSSTDFILGLQYQFGFYKVAYALTKTVLFAFIIGSVSAFYGFYTEGGALEVGQSSTKAVVNSSVIVIVMNLVLTDILLS